MSKELIIHSTSSDIQIALLQDKKLIELHEQERENNFTVGDIFLARIKMMRPGLNAAFMDIGSRSDAFLHYTDLGPQINSLLKYTNVVKNGQKKTPSLKDFPMEKDNQKNGKITNVFKKNQYCLVQILKEPISTKGPRLSCEITLPGRYIVLAPFGNLVSVSKKINDEEERTRLKRLIESVKPPNFSVIIRTAAQGKKVADLYEEVKALEQRWNDIHGELISARTPKKLLSEQDKTISIIRDMLTDDFSSVVIDNRNDYDATKNYLTTFAPDKLKLLKFHSGKESVFKSYNVSSQVTSSFSKNPTLPSGAYLVIEKTEAMHVIDVNSGPRSQRQDQESSALKVNLETAKEIARQLRLRDIGGLIIIDFIDMRKAENKNALYKVMREAMEGDRAQHTVLPLSKFGLMQITRQRVKPAIEKDTSDQCPVCDGTGKVNATSLIVEDIDSNLNFILASRPSAKLQLRVHPYVGAYLQQGLPNTQMKWLIKHKRWIKIVNDETMYINSFKFFDNLGDEIRIG